MPQHFATHYVLSTVITRDATYFRLVSSIRPIRLFLAGTDFAKIYTPAPFAITYAPPPQVKRFLDGYRNLDSGQTTILCYNYS